MDCNSLQVCAESSSSARQSEAQKIKFACDLCGAPFYHRLGLATHMRRLHGDEEETTQTFVVLKKKENIIHKKKNNRVRILSGKSTKIIEKKYVKDARSSNDISEMNGNKDYIVSLEICDEDEKDQDNVLLEICDVDEKSHNDTSASNDSLEADENDQYNAQLEFSATNTEMDKVIPSTLCETNLQDDNIQNYMQDNIRIDMKNDMQDDIQDDMSSEMHEGNSSILSHYFIVKEDGKTLFECSKCGKRYRHKRSLNRHLHDVHFSGRINEEYRCICHASFKGKKNMSSHLIRIHTENKSLCKLCEESFESLRILTKHMIDKHCTVSFSDTMFSDCPVSSSVHLYPEQDEHSNSRFYERITSSPPVSSPEHLFIKQEEGISPEENNQTVFLPIECDILPVEFEITPKQEMMEIEIEGIE